MQQTTFDPQKYQNGVNMLDQINEGLHESEDSGAYFLAVLIENGKLSLEQIKTAEKLLAEKDALEAEKQRKIQAEQKAKDDAFNEPEQAYPRLFNRKTANPLELQNWLKKTDKSELKILLEKLKAQPFHWTSLYSKASGGIVEAIAQLERAIENKEKKPKN